VQVAAVGGALLGSEIEDRPLQASPSNMTWNTAPAPAATPPKPAATKALTAEALAQAPPAETPQSASDIDSLLDKLAGSSPDAPSPAAPVAASSSAVQAGAYSSRANAERAAAAMEGQTQIVPVEQAGRTLYKVMLVQ
jgi:hypothetical protein